MVSLAQSKKTSNYHSALRSLARPPVAEEAPAPAGDTENVVGWIVGGIGRMLPQPVLKKDNNDGVENRAMRAP
ncbi:unnamed protein product [Boreogadus saida]